MSDGTRVTGARAKGVNAAEKTKAGKPGKGNPYSDARPAMQAAWNEGYAAALDAEPEFKAKGKPAKAAKVKALAAQTPFTVDEVAAAAESDEGPELSNTEISKILDADDVLLGGY